MKFIRHGESEANLKNIWGGDSPLTQMGRLQALILLEKEESPVVVTSGMQRAVDTAKIAFPDAKVIVDDSFREIWFGDVDGQKIDFEGEVFKSFINDPQKIHYIIDGDNIEVRARQALERAMTYPMDTVVITHGTLMQAMRSLYKYGTINKMHKDERFENCEIWEVDFTR